MEKAKSMLPSEAEQKARQEMYPDMLFVPAGPVLIGALGQEFEYKIPGSEQNLAADGEFGARERQLDGFFIDRFEWPNRLKDEEGNPQKPSIKVTHDVAEQACRGVGKRLCTSAEWEKACKGFENSIYSYGDSIDEEICPSNFSAYVLGQDPDCKSSYGVYGMSAGPREWTGTTATSGTRFVTKGGSLRGHPERSYRCAHSGDDNENYTDINLSFRCCRSDNGVKKEDPADVQN